MYKTDKIYLNKWCDIPLAYHPTNTGKTIINIPGAGGSLDGYQNKYVNLGNYMQKRNIASFVRIPNDTPHEFTLAARKVINYCIDNSKKISGNMNSEIWLMGFSAGGTSVILTGWEYPEIKKVMAINPAIGSSKVKKCIQRALNEYTGELFIIVGENDTVITADTIKFIEKYATGVKNTQSHIIPNCDHELRGEVNSKILSQLPEYYFLGKYKTEPFPDGKKGIYLLEKPNR